MQKPTIGRIVIYKTTENDRKLAELVGDNQATELPATIVRVWGPSTVNLKVHTDGKQDQWKTSSTQGDQPGQWNWPVREEASSSEAVGGETKPEATV